MWWGREQHLGWVCGLGRGRAHVPDPLVTQWGAPLLPDGHRAGCCPHSPLEVGTQRGFLRAHPWRSALEWGTHVWDLHFGCKSANLEAVELIWGILGACLLCCPSASLGCVRMSAATRRHPPACAGDTGAASCQH